MILLAKVLAPDFPCNTISSGMIATGALKKLPTEAVELELPSNGVG
jgi:hypothetical protein